MTTIVNDWFAALGQPVNDENFQAALALCDEWGLHHGNSRLSLDVICREIRHDNPDRAFKYAESLVGRSNQTAVYRLLATLAATTRESRVNDLLELREELHEEGGPLVDPSRR